MNVKLPPRTNNGKKKKGGIHDYWKFFAGSMSVTIGEKRKKLRFIDLKILIS